MYCRRNLAPSVPLGLILGLIHLGAHPEPARAQRGGLYVGAGVAGQSADLDYSKTVDSTPENNQSATPGSVFTSESSARGLSYGTGILAGYRLALRPTGFYFSFEGDLLRHGGTLRGALRGAGVSAGFDQIGDVWPEEWSFRPERSYGATLRVGSGVPILGTGSGASVYLLVGVRRTKAHFAAEWEGCLDASACAEGGGPQQGVDQFSEIFNGWVTGAGLEKRFGPLGIRGEVRYADHREAGRTIQFDEVGVRVPLTLGSGSLGARADLLWYF